MEFTIYDISDYAEEQIDSFDFEKYEDELTELEMGLSSGELRQSLLDRFRETARRKEALFINVNFEKYDLTISEDDLESDLEIASIVEDIDKILYDLEDEDLDETVWNLPQEVIYIKGESW